MSMSNLTFLLLLTSLKTETIKHNFEIDSKKLREKFQSLFMTNPSYILCISSLLNMYEVFITQQW